MIDPRSGKLLKSSVEAGVVPSGAAAWPGRRHRRQVADALVGVDRVVVHKVLYRERRAVADAQVQAIRKGVPVKIRRPPARPGGPATKSVGNLRRDVAVASSGLPITVDRRGAAHVHFCVPSRQFGLVIWQDGLLGVEKQLPQARGGARGAYAGR